MNRVREHAETLVDWSARIDEGDDVVVRVAEGTHDLAVAVAGVLGERNANAVTVYDSDEVERAYLRGHDDAFDADPAFELELYANADAVLGLGGGRNTAATADVPGGTRAAYRRAREGVREARLATDWVSTVHPTRSLAQQAGMAYEGYCDFVYEAVLRDWSALADEMARLKELLDGADTVRIVREDTDLRLDVTGRTAVNSCASVAYDSHNLPSGEVFTAPASATGTITFDVPMTVDGQPLRGVSLDIEDGEVVDCSAREGEDRLRDILDTDPGARRLGELGIGMNRGIDRPTNSVLFDEKMAGTVHLAVGRAYDACLPDGEAGNDSAVHQDFITRMDAGRLEVDGEVVQRDGLFRWEEGF